MTGLIIHTSHEPIDPGLLDTLQIAGIIACIVLAALCAAYGIWRSRCRRLAAGQPKEGGGT